MGCLRLAINSKMLCGGGKTYGSVSKGRACDQPPGKLWNVRHP